MAEWKERTLHRLTLRYTAIDTGGDPFADGTTRISKEYKARKFKYFWFISRKMNASPIFVAHQPDKGLSGF